MEKNNKNQERKVEKTKKYFINKDMVQIAIMAVAMLLASGTVPLVTAIPFPGIRTMVCAPFYGLIIALSYARVQKPGVATVITTLSSLPMAFISPVIPLFTIVAGIVTDLYFKAVKSQITVKTMVLSGTILMAVMMVVGTWSGVVLLGEADLPTLKGFYSGPIKVIIGFLGSAGLGGLGAWLATKIFKEFKFLDEE